MKDITLKRAFSTFKRTESEEIKHFMELWNRVTFSVSLGSNHLYESIVFIFVSMDSKFSDFSKIRKSHKSLEHELGSI